MKINFDKDWRNIPLPAVFDVDFAAFIKSLSRKQRNGQPAMAWTDLGPFAHAAYQLHSDLASQYEFLKGKGRAPTVLPDDATPEGFYLAAVACRRKQVGIDAPFVPTPFERLGPLSHFLYRRMADRIARCAGFKAAVAPTIVDDGLGGDLDDGLGGSDNVEDDGLGGDLDDGLGQVELFDELGDGL